MHFHYAAVWSALAIAAHAGPCASAPFHSGNAFFFQEQSAGAWQADFTGGHLRYTANKDPNVAGSLDLVNDTQDRKVMCVGALDANDWTCWWLNGRDTCNTSVLLDTSQAASVSQTT
ncbi:hypothetical protein C8034_v002172 [Colletotrichum sidae]|uniref:Uncharacterized protein n=1 Tax=Colletotrichum sidae TaxID=1347389 RepID=A0A4R8TUE5_9PEZI|nr:hypothetical protein C8034_v002172 [Colletotrichum sidae]